MSRKIPKFCGPDQFYWSPLLCPKYLDRDCNLTQNHFQKTHGAVLLLVKL